MNESADADPSAPEAVGPPDRGARPGRVAGTAARIPSTATDPAACPDMKRHPPRPPDGPPRAGEALRGPVLALVACCVPFALFVFSPVSVWGYNVLEFPFLITEALPYLLGLALAGATVVLLVLLLFRGPWRDRAVALLLGLATALWIQGTFLTWSYGALDGRAIDWAQKPWRAWVELAVWGLVVGLFLAGWRRVRPHAAPIAGALLGVPGGAALVLVLSVDAYPSYLRNAVDAGPLFRLSSSRNVIVLVLDGLQTTEFYRLLAGEPALRESFTGFTYFRNALADFPITHASIPAILTARRYDNSEPYLDFIERAYGSSSSLPKLLKQRGYTVDLYGMFRAVWADESVMSNVRSPEGGLRAFGGDLAYLLDLGLFRALPQPGKRLVYANQAWCLRRLAPRLGLGRRAAVSIAGGIRDSVDFLADFVRSSTPPVSGPVFKLFHLLGPHPPLSIDEKGEKASLPYDAANYRRACVGSVRVAEAFLRELRRRGLYDRSLIFILSDHGYAVLFEMPPDVVARGGGAPTPYGRALPLVLVKPIGSDGPMRTSDAPVLLSDVPKTALTLLGLPAGSMPGSSMFDLREDTARTRIHTAVDDTNWEKSRYLSVMTDFAVDGFSWSSSSWRPTGRVRGSYRDALAAFRSLERSPFLGQPACYSSAGADPRMLVTNEGILDVFFPDADPERGDYAGVTFPLEGLEKGRRYRLSLEVVDPYTGTFPGRFLQVLWLDDRMIESYDLGAGASSGPRRVTYEFRALARDVTLKAELRAVGTPEKGWGWGNSAGVGIRDIRLEAIGP